MSQEIDYSVPFRVIVVEDCRKNSEAKLDGHKGFCLGTYDYDRHEEYPGEPFKELDHVLGGNPLIKTESGHFIWGIECWWTKLDEGKEEIPLGVMKEVLKMRRRLAVLSLDLDPSDRN